MELFFLFCFVFGALFLIASASLGFVDSALHGGHAGDAGQLGHGGHGAGSHNGGQVGHDVGLDHGAESLDASGHALDVHAAGHQVADGGHHALATTGHGPSHSLVPYFFSTYSLLAFLTCFGAIGFLLLRFALWPTVPAVGVAMLVGGGTAALMALGLAWLKAGEQVMRPEDYRLEGTTARVTVTIPTGGVGEIQFSKMGSRRSEAARGADGRAIGRGREVVILDYIHGVATVQPWEDLLVAEESRKRLDGTSGEGG